MCLNSILERGKRWNARERSDIESLVVHLSFTLFINSQDDCEKIALPK